MNRHTVHKSRSRSRKVELGEEDEPKQPSEHWTRLLKCWASYLIGCRINRCQTACAIW